MTGQVVCAVEVYPDYRSFVTHPGRDNSRHPFIYFCMEKSTARANWLPQEHNPVSLSRARRLVHWLTKSIKWLTKFIIWFSSASQCYQQDSSTWGNLLPSRQRMYYTYVPGLHFWDACLKVLCTAPKRKYPTVILALKMTSWHESFLE